MAIKAEVNDAEFNELHKLLDKRGKNVTVSKELLGRLLRDHAALWGQVK